MNSTIKNKLAHFQSTEIIIRCSERVSMICSMCSTRFQCFEKKEKKNHAYVWNILIDSYFVYVQGSLTTDKSTTQSGKQGSRTTKTGQETSKSTSQQTTQGGRKRNDYKRRRGMNYLQMINLTSWNRWICSIIKELP